MIITHTLHPDLSRPYEEMLEVSTIASLNKAFGMMGRRFVGRPRKAQVVKGIAHYVREHPLDVLHRLHSDSLMYLQQLINQGKGSVFTIEGINLFNELQNMHLVLTYEDDARQSTHLFLIDELHDLFAPHIDEAYKHPSVALQKNMVKGLEGLANELHNADDPTKRSQELLIEIMSMRLAHEIKTIRESYPRLLERTPDVMTTAEFRALDEEVHKKLDDLQEAIADLQKARKESKEISREQQQLTHLLFSEAKEVANELKEISEMCRQLSILVKK